MGVLFKYNCIEELGRTPFGIIARSSLSLGRIHRDSKVFMTLKWSLQEKSYFSYIKFPLSWALSWVNCWCLWANSWAISCCPWINCCLCINKSVICYQPSISHRWTMGVPLPPYYNVVGIFWKHTRLMCSQAGMMLSSDTILVY